jgi:hypothetical protein
MLDYLVCNETSPLFKEIVEGTILAVDIEDMLTLSELKEILNEMTFKSFKN